MKNAEILQFSKPESQFFSFLTQIKHFQQNSTTYFYPNVQISKKEISGGVRSQKGGELQWIHLKITYFRFINLILWQNNRVPINYCQQTTVPNSSKWYVTERRCYATIVTKQPGRRNQTWQKFTEEVKNLGLEIVEDTKISRKISLFTHFDLEKSGICLFWEKFL